MDPRLVRALATAAALAIVGLGASIGSAQQSGGADGPANSGAVTTAPASPASPEPAPSPSTQPPVTMAPPPESMPPSNADAASGAEAEANVNAVAAQDKPVTPVAPARPIRGQVAVLQALDKVTAETMRFQTPVGGKVRYKSLIIEVKVCETRGTDEPLPKASAYLVVTSDPRGTVRGDLIVRKEVFRGWMFANSPGLHALQHPTYDLWLITCGAAPGAPVK